MCGIAGVLGTSAADVAEPGLTRALDLMRHRGPDGSGQWRGRGIWLGHRRLAIIDVSDRGAQPMCSADARFICTFNGEIYNFRDIRAKLEGLGTRFVGRSDTEVLVQAYAAWGAEMLTQLDGMFAFAIWDDVERTLLLARDRFGEKPLYYASTASGFTFASDPKAILAITGQTVQIDLPALVANLIYGYQRDSSTVFRGIHSLEPSTYMMIDGEGRIFRQEPYWTWHPPREAPGLDYEEYLAHLEECLRTVVRRRLISERPLGVLLSGGVDSSLTAAVAAQEAGRSIDAYTVAFDDEEFDESPYARRVAEQFGLQHHVLSTPSARLEALPNLLWHYGVPFHDFSSIPTAAVFHAVSGRCVVCLTGDGGDEMFAGYTEPLLFRWLAGYRQIPATVRAFLRGVLRPGWRFGRLGRRLAKWSTLGALPLDKAFAHIKDSIWDGTIPLRHAPSRKEVVTAFASMAETYRRTNGSAVHRYLQAHAATQFVHDFLVKVDVASMASSVEARTPFLSPDIAEWAARAPAEWLLKDGRPKRILKDLALKLLPEDLVLRPKQGFTPPMRNWLRGSLRGPAEQLLHPRVVERRGLFEAPQVKALLDAHLSGATDHTYPLWVLISLEIWWRLFVDASASPETPLGELALLEPVRAIDDALA